MAKFLDTMEITSAIQRILKNAKEKVVLISPYVDFDPRYKLLIKEKNDEHIPVTLVWGKKNKQFKFSGEEKDWIKSMEFVDDIFCKELHAKCYLNEIRERSVQQGNRRGFGKKRRRHPRNPAPSPETTKKTC